MPRTALTTPHPLSTAGLDPSTVTVNADNTNGMLYPSNPNRFILVTNTSGGSVNLTLRDPTVVDGEAVPDRVVAIATGKTMLVGPVPGNYTQADGNVYIDFSAGGATVQVAVIDI